MSWMIAILVFGIGVAAGMLVNYLLSSGTRQVRDLERQLAAARDEHAAYRREVSEHFTRTALAVNQLTENYRAVHAQLRDGAHRLCDNAAAETALAFDQSRLIGSAPGNADAAAAEASAALPGDPDRGTGETDAATDTPSDPRGMDRTRSAEGSADDAASPPRDYAEERSEAASRRAR